MTEASERSRSMKLYPTLTLAISATAFLGFYFTYFGPMAAGTYPTVSPVIHVHGWSFFLWYLLLPSQALIISSGRHRLHFRLGSASVLLVAVMTLTGLVVSSVRIAGAIASDAGDPVGDFWERFGLVITFGLFLFVGFYVAALTKRRQPETHKRLIIVASASALPAAVFRILVAFGGFHWLSPPSWVLPAAIFLPNLFVLAGALHDLKAHRSVPPAYVVGLVVALAVGTLGFALATNPAGDPLRRALAGFADVVGLSY